MRRIPPLVPESIGARRGFGERAWPVWPRWYRVLTIRIDYLHQRPRGVSTIEAMRHWWRTGRFMVGRFEN